MLRLLLSVLLFLPALVVHGDVPESLLLGGHRTHANVERDVYRHPLETLAFFEVGPRMTVVEIWPGTGWYTEILAPYLRNHGTLYAAHFPQHSDVAYYTRVRKAFEDKLHTHPEVYDRVRLSELNPQKPDSLLGDPLLNGTADRVLTFRNVHNWMNSGTEHLVFAGFFKALKPGGILGVVEHRAKPGSNREQMVNSGYVTQEYVIDLAEQAGFEFVGASEINANPKDTTRHPKGVWTLPPTLSLGEQDRKNYLAIGESDRMTLKFRKP